MHLSFLITLLLVASSCVVIDCQVFKVELGSDKPLQGENVTLLCKGKGDKLLWRHRRHNLTSDGLKFEINTNISKANENAIISHLHILNIKESGRYKCIIWKENVESEKTFAIHVQVPPKLKEIENGTVFVGSKAVLSCGIVAVPAPQVRWLSPDDTQISLDDRYKIEDRNESSMHVSQLSIEDVILNDNGTYKCVFENKHGSIVGMPYLLAQDVPEVSFEIARSLGPNEVQLQWIVTDNNSPINSTEITIISGDKPETIVTVKPVIETSMILDTKNFKFDSLSTDDSQEVTLLLSVSVSNSIGTDETGFINVTMLRERPIFTPTASFKGSTLDSLTVRWDPPPENISSYIDYYLLSLTNLTTGETIKVDEDRTSTLHLFVNLKDGTAYEFTVSACMDVFHNQTKDCGPPSSPIAQKTLSMPPDSVSDITVVCFSNRTTGENRVYVDWQPPSNDSMVTQYQIELIASANYINEFQKEKFFSSTLKKTFDSVARNHTFVNMMPNTNYTAKIYAGAGGLFSSPLSSNCETPFWVPHFSTLHWWKSQSGINTVLKLFTPTVSQRNGTICCHRIVVVKLGYNRTINDLPNPSKLPLRSYYQVHEMPELGGYVAEAFSNRRSAKQYIYVGDGETTEDGPEGCAKCLGLYPIASPSKENLPSQAGLRRSSSKDWDIAFHNDKINPLRMFKRSLQVSPIAEDLILSKEDNYTGFLILNVRDKNGTSLSTYSDYFDAIQPKEDPAPYTTPAASASNKNYAIYALSAIIALLILTGMILGLLLCHYHRKRKPIIEDGLDESLTGSLGRIFRTLRRSHTLMSQAGKDVKPISKEELVPQYLEKIKDSGLGFRKEFESLPERFYDRTSRGSEMSENSCKNRYPDIKAYDQTRVKLSQINGIVGSNYINANFVLGYKERKKFICAQGPMESTVNDFWRMIVEQRSSLCIMLTNLEETGKVKCVKYWPEAGEPKTFGNITVRLVKEKPYADYLVRTLRAEWPATASAPGAAATTTTTITTPEATPTVTNEENGVITSGTSTTKSNSSNTCHSNSNSNYNSLSSRSATASEETKFHEVQQYHYLMWKDFVAPEHPVGLLSFLRRINEAYSPDLGPLLIHCSAGVGRTGTLVALDTLVAELDEEKQASIFNAICDLRHQRNFLVQSLKQYIFIHRALMEYAQFGNSELNIAQLKDVWLRHSQHNSEEPTEIARQFERLGKVIEDRKAFTVANSDANKCKNRYDFVLPYDTNCVILTPMATQIGATYINASFVAGFDLGENFIVTQDPLENTLGDFWRMIYEQEVNTIVMISELGSGENCCSKYWPDSEESYDHINVKFLASESYPKYNTRSFSVTNTKNGDSVSVTQFHYVGWSGNMGEVPLVTLGIMEIITRVQSHNDTNPSNISPTIVHCSGGGDRSSVYVCLNNCLRQLRRESCVDVFQTARKIRSQRQFQLQDVGQYEFIYKALVEHVDLRGCDNL